MPTAWWKKANGRTSGRATRALGALLAWSLCATTPAQALPGTAGDSAGSGAQPTGPASARELAHEEPRKSVHEGTCGPSRLGQPCPQGGAATQGPSGPTLSLGAGNPVHLVTGNKYQREIDLPAPAGRLGVEIVRHYNALDPRTSTLGRGWSLSYEARLYVQRASAHVQLVQADGSRADFHCGTETCRALPPAQGSLSRDRRGWRWNWPDGRRLHFDAGGRLVRIAGRAQDYIDITRETRPGPVQGEILTVTDSQGDTLRFAYQAAPAGARLVRIDTPYGVYVYEYDTPAGDHARPVREAGPSARNAGIVHRLIGMAHPAGWRRDYLHERAMQSGNPYRLTGIAWKLGKAEPVRLRSWAYDKAGRAILSAHGGPGASHQRVELEYLSSPDPGGGPGLTRVRSAGGITDFHTAIRAGRPVLMRVEGSGCPGCAAPGLRADYDGAGRLTRLNALRLQRDASGALSVLHDAASGWPGLTMRFDQHGRLSEWESHATGSEARRRDAAGRVAERRYANGDVWRYAYDARGRPVEVIAHSVSGSLRTTIAWRADRAVHIAHPHEREARRYDRRGRLTARAVRRSGSGAIPPEPAYGYVERYAWDDRNRLIRHELPEGGRLSYAYDELDGIVRITWEDGHGGTRDLLRAGEAAGYWHGNGLRTQGLLRRNGLHALMVDRAARPDAAPVFLQRLDYEASGRIAVETFLLGNWRSSIAYGYDHAGRMQGASALAHRPAAKERHAWRYAWYASGQSLAGQHNGNTHMPLLRRDASGLPLAYGDRRLRYGPDRRLQSVMRGEVELASYAHNAYGERIRRRAAGRTEHYLYDRNRMVARARSMAGGRVGVTHRYVYAGWVPVAIIEYAQARTLGASLPQARLAPPAFYAIHADASGMPHAVTDALGHVAWRAQWSPTGQALAMEGGLDMPLRQPGHVYDAATGWHDNYLRSYDPRTGHYLEPDPAGPMPDSQVYGHAAQRPRRHADPWGLLLFAFDGTGRDLRGRTNVSLMSSWYADGTAFYHRGPGFATPRFVDAATAGSAPTILQTQWHALLRELRAAAGRGQRVPIDLLGYSRGAALALHFGNSIANAYNAGRFWIRDAALGTITACVDLRFMGLFDAVAQFGLLGADNADYDLAVSAEWRWVAHAVALHERRWLFPLTATPDGQANVVAAPFVGAHGDIGGGYLPEPADTDTARPGGDLSDVALAWMLRQADRAGTPFRTPPPAFTRVDNPILHDERGTRMRRRNGDRRVLDDAGRELLGAQDAHPAYGARVRAQTEAFIRRVANWTESPDSAVATVDMAGYEAWLQRALGPAGTR